LTDQSISVEADAGAGQAIAVHLRDVSVWHWHAAAGVRIPLVQGVSWEVREGERWALLGQNGAGKTTLLGVAGAIAFPSSGTADVLGRRLGQADLPSLRQEIGHVDVRDTMRFTPGLTVEEAIRTGATGTIGLFPDRLTQGDVERARELIAVFGLARLAGRRLRDCSQGERARALVARALLARPRLLLLDEPAAGVDLPGREALLAALDRLAVDLPRLAVVITTHHLEELPAATTHALLLREGRALAAGAVGATLTDALLSDCFGLPLVVERAARALSGAPSRCWTRRAFFYILLAVLYRHSSAGDRPSRASIRRCPS
jgi:iron complex transport system ATP-binding protein